MNAKRTLLFLFTMLCSYVTIAQVVVCANSPCTSNDFTIESFYLGDEFGVPFGPGYCEPGTTVTAHLWINFTANSAADRYDLYVHFNLYVDGVFIETVDECYFDDQPIPINVSLDTYTFSWECGSDIELHDLYMSWQTVITGTCGCSSSHCYSEPIIIVQAPLIANFTYEASCLSAYTVDFTSTTSGGAPPYTYFWDFGDGGTSTLANPSHTYATNGPYTVTLTVVDTENTDSYGFDIVEFDSNIPPELTAPPDTTLSGCDTSVISPFVYSEIPVQITEPELNAMGGSLLIGNDIVSLSYVDTSSGNCPILVLRTFTIVDSCNNTDIETQTIAILDDTPPTASNPAPIIVSCIGDVPPPDISVVSDASDNCSTPTVAFVSDVSDNQSCPETITRTYSVTDACNNSIEVAQSIVIMDDVLPTASNPAPITVSCIGDVPPPDISVVSDASDNCGTPTVTFVSDVSDNQSCPHTITRTYSVTDVCNNSIEVTQSIVIMDDVLPTASNPAPITVSCIGDVPPPDISVVSDASDNCGIPTVAFVSDVSDNQSCPETITRTYSVTDACDNSIEVTQSIIIMDDVLPTASNPAPINVSCIGDVPAPDISVVSDASDNCGIPTMAFVSDVSDNQSCPETITRTYSVTDACNNSIEVTQSIVIMDDVLPTASNPAPITVSCIGDVPPPDISVVSDTSDNCGTPTVAFVSDVSDNQTCPETITRTYSVTDTCNNSIEVTQSIVIMDDVLPTASNPAPITVSCIGDVPAPDISVVTDASDNCGTPTVTFVSDVSDNQSCPETITRTYSVTDACNNSIEVTQSIVIMDDVFPTASNPAPITVSCIGDVPPPDISVVSDASDNCGAPTVAFVSDVSDNQSCPETITRTYSVTDACNNSIEVTQSIVIMDDVLPTASNPAPITVSCISDVPAPDISVVSDASDNCGTPTVVFVSDVSDNQSCPETITRTYSVTDTCNNSIEVTQSIVIMDDVLPTASNPAPITVSCISDVPAPDISVVSDASDNCGTPTVAFVSDVSDNQSCPETITRTYSITDTCNNSIEVTQSIVIIDDVLPTASNPAPITVSCIGDVPPPDISVVTDASDNCGTPTVAFVSDISYSIGCPQIITRTYSVTDACNNSIEVTQSIVIMDDVLPTASNPAPITVSCIGDVPAPDISVVSDASDNCGIPTVAFVSDVSDNQSCPETITRTYSVTDTCNNSIEVTQSIVIMDDVLPTASNPAPITVSCIGDVPVPDISVVSDASDNCGIPTVAFVSDVSDNQSCPETIIRTYSVTDTCNNSIEVTQSIVIMDDVLPTASNPAPITVSCIGDVPPPDISVVTDASDNCGTPTVTFVSDVSDNQSCPETITRTYSVTDACNNSIEVTQAIIIHDEIAPEVITPFDPELFVGCEDIPDAPILDFIDNCSQDLTVNYSETVNEIDEYSFDLIRNWIVSDACNNSSSFIQTVYVRRTADKINFSIDLCIADDPFDLNLLIVNTPHMDGEWYSDTLELLDGTIFDPRVAGTGTFIFTYIYEEEECFWQTEVLLNLNDNCDIGLCINSKEDVKISKLVTPNNDGYNDYFEVNYILNDENSEFCEVTTNVQFFNRWGVKVYSSSNYNNDWSGNYEGNSNFLPAGTYYYIVSLENSGLDPIQGFILLGTE